MPFDISRYAKALPAILGLKERGRGIPMLADQAVGILDIGQLYLLDNRETVLFTANAAPAVGANSFGTAVLVPAGELWFVWDFMASTVAGAGAAIDFAPMIAFDAVAGMAVGPYVAAAANQQARGMTLGPRWVTPGSEFGFHVRSVTLAPTVNGAAVVTKLRI